GTLGGPSSNVQWPGLNNGGTIVGISWTGTPDTLGEDWSCLAFLPSSTGTCLGFVWEDDVMTPLPTFGGDHGFATGVNSRGQIVGWAETAVLDPTCDAPAQRLQFRAALWEPKKGTVQALPPLAGHSATAAVGINDKGQVAGISGDCDQAVGRFSALRAVIWENGVVRPIPDLGGITWHTSQDINEHGDVVGFSNPPGEDPVGDFIAHAFLWTYGSATALDLGTLDGDPVAQAQAINNERQVVGVSFGGANGLRAFLWQDGVLHDLNDLVGPGFGPGQPYQLRSGRDINDAGQITGDVLERATGRILAFVATPVAP
ncbi:MAG: hypothetical protein ACREME_13180, partial [Gemmatimonadales bacterium]